MTLDVHQSGSDGAGSLAIEETLGPVLGDGLGAGHEPVFGLVVGATRHRGLAHIGVHPGAVLLVEQGELVQRKWRWMEFAAEANMADSQHYEASY